MKNMSSLSRVTLLPDSRSKHTGNKIKSKIKQGAEPYGVLCTGIFS